MYNFFCLLLSDAYINPQRSDGWMVVCMFGNSSLIIWRLRFYRVLGLSRVLSSCLWLWLLAARLVLSTLFLCVYFEYTYMVKIIIALKCCVSAYECTRREKDQILKYKIVSFLKYTLDFLLFHFVLEDNNQFLCLSQFLQILIFTVF